ncbi:hypothetical protein J7382_05140 [Shimia sp. R11_0]|uniref:hypothetical protein n=1 Tax=Shimia sp. R11_0 TaxID=2821096 RepID=UPI001ADAB52C|nr:hypothetical protein [Shimia sp. R11_0]MBO9476916.1 hypothetical protein [Shimia sp. R11_0]
MIPVFDTAAANFFAAAFVVLALCFWWFVSHHLDGLDAHPDQAQATGDRYELPIVDVSEFLRSLQARGIDLTKPQKIIHSCEKMATEEATSVDILRSTFYEIGYDDYSSGPSDGDLMIYHLTRVDTEGFERRISEIIAILSEHGWNYRGFELFNPNEEEVH